ncbi:ribokinase [Muricomes intestini]|jgi:ribokinase|uniref:ribokinase n=1 Tax=Muricomes intestini TaxID=1796634 RepID=UPI002FDAC773
MAKKDVIVLNSHGVGQYAYTDHMPKWGETLSVKNWYVAEDGGKGTNVAVALGRLGIDTAYIGKVGNDPWGDLGEKWLKEAGADATYMYRTDEVSTGTGLILIGPEGQNTVIDGDSSSIVLKEEEVIQALDNMKGSTFFVTGFEVPMRIALAGAKYAKKLGMLTVLNPSPLPEEPMKKLDYIDYLFINEVEGRYICNEAEDAELEPRRLMEEVQEIYGVGNVIMTLGAEGSTALQGEEFFNIPPVRVEKVVNTAGAGDGFMAAAIANLVWGKTLKEAMEWAGKYAALSVTINGTIPAYRPLDEVNAFIEKYN